MPELYSLLILVVVLVVVVLVIAAVSRVFRVLERIVFDRLGAVEGQLRLPPRLGKPLRSKEGAAEAISPPAHAGQNVLAEPSRHGAKGGGGQRAGGSGVALTLALRCRVFILLWRFFGTAMTTSRWRVGAERTLPGEGARPSDDGANPPLQQVVLIHTDPASTQRTCTN